MGCCTRCIISSGSTHIFTHNLKLLHMSYRFSMNDLLCPNFFREIILIRKQNKLFSDFFPREYVGADIFLIVSSLNRYICIDEYWVQLHPIYTIIYQVYKPLLILNISVVVLKHTTVARASRFGIPDLICPFLQKLLPHRHFIYKNQYLSVNIWLADVHNIYSTFHHSMYNHIPSSFPSHHSFVCKQCENSVYTWSELPATVPGVPAVMTSPSPVCTTPLTTFLFSTTALQACQGYIRPMSVTFIFSTIFNFFIIFSFPIVFGQCPVSDTVQIRKDING